MNANTTQTRTIPRRWPSREPVHLAFEDLLIISLLCLWWAMVILAAIDWGL